MTNTKMLETINYLLKDENLSLYTKNILKQTKEQLEKDIMSENNKINGKKFVYDTCIKIMNRCKSRPVLSFAHKTDNYLELTDTITAIRFKNNDYVNLPTNNEFGSYPNMDFIFEKAKENTIEVELPSLNELKNLYKIKKAEKTGEMFIKYIVNQETKTTVDLVKLIEVLQVFNCEKEISIKCNASNKKPIYFESENIIAVLLPLRVFD